MLAKQLTLKEAGAILGVGYARAATLAREGILPVTYLGRQIRVDPERLEEFIRAGGRRLPRGSRWTLEGGQQAEAARG